MVSVLMWVSLQFIPAMVRSIAMVTIILNIEAKTTTMNSVP